MYRKVVVYTVYQKIANFYKGVFLLTQKLFSKYEAYTDDRCAICGKVLTPTLAKKYSVFKKHKDCGNMYLLCCKEHSNSSKYIISYISSEGMLQIQKTIKNRKRHGVVDDITKIVHPAVESKPKIIYPAVKPKLKTNQTCACCGKVGKMTIDHFVPKSYLKSTGITDSVTNHIYLCLECNQEKGDNLYFPFSSTYTRYMGRDAWLDLCAWFVNNVPRKNWDKFR